MASDELFLKVVMNVFRVAHQVTVKIDAFAGKTWSIDGRDHLPRDTAQYLIVTSLVQILHLPRSS